MEAALRRRKTECVSNCCRIRGRQMFHNPMRWITSLCSNKQTGPSFWLSLKGYRVGHGSEEEVSVWLLRGKAPGHRERVWERWMSSAQLVLPSLLPLPLFPTQVKVALMASSLQLTSNNLVVVDGRNPWASLVSNTNTEEKRVMCGR